jgi:hypothetical protein
MDEAQLGEPTAMEIVVEMRARAQDFINHCDREIKETEQRLKYWMNQRQEMQNFLSLDQFEVKQEMDAQDNLREAVSGQLYAPTDLRSSYASR